MSICDALSVRVVKNGNVYIDGTLKGLDASKEYALKYARDGRWVNLPNARQAYTYIINATYFDAGGWLGGYLPVDRGYTSYAVALFEVKGTCENVVKRVCTKYLSTRVTPKPPTPVNPAPPIAVGTCSMAHDNRNGVSWHISRMVGTEGVRWVRVRPTRMQQPNPTQPATVDVTITESDGGKVLYNGTVTSGEEVEIPVHNFTHNPNLDALMFVAYDVDMMAGTCEMRLCSVPNRKVNLNLSIYDENEEGCEGAVATYNGQTKTSNHNGFISFLVLADVVDDLNVRLPIGYTTLDAQTSFTHEDLTAVSTYKPESDVHMYYIKVMHSTAGGKEGVTIVVPRVIIAGQDVKIRGTSSVPYLDVTIMAKKKLFGSDLLAADTMIASTTVAENHEFETTAKFEEFGLIEMYAKITDKFQSPTTTTLVVTPMILLATLAMLVMVLDKKYGFIGIFKKGGKK